MSANWKKPTKIATSPIIIPMCVLAMFLWPWWCKQSLLRKILTGALILPITGFAMATSKWWGDL